MRLVILYDASCPFCIWCREWMQGQPAFVTLDFLDCRSPSALARYGAIPVLRSELCVVSDAGEVWWGPAAFLMCLWALVRWREMACGLSGTLSPLARLFFRVLSAERHRLARWFGHSSCTAGACGAARTGPYR